MADVPEHARGLIYESLTNAQHGGYEVDVRRHPDIIADDMAICDADVERMLEDGVVTHAELSSVIADWQKEHNV